MRNSSQTFFWNKLACGSANSVGLVFNTHKRSLQMLDELALTLGKTGCFLRIEGRGTDLLGETRLIFTFVIVKALFRADLDGGERLSVQNTDGKFSALDFIFN